MVTYEGNGISPNIANIGDDNGIYSVILEEDLTIYQS